MDSARAISSCVRVERVGAQPTELDVALINIALFAPVLSLCMCQKRECFSLLICLLINDDLLRLYIHPFMRMIIKVRLTNNVAFLQDEDTGTLFFF